MQLVYQIDNNVTKRESKWVFVCSNCQCERIGSYAQAWNISTGKSSDKCYSCINGKYYKTKKIKSRSLVCFYRNIFNNPSKSKEARIKQKNAKLGKYGELANRWEGGKTQQRVTEMSREIYKNLRKQVFNRDSFTCKICLIKGGNLEMDHIKEWANYPELRYEISNCRTLCVRCHKTTDNYGFKAIKGKVA